MPNDVIRVQGAWKQFIRFRGRATGYPNFGTGGAPSVAGVLMDAKEADAVLAAQESIFELFCSRHGLGFKKNDHFESINRVFQWKDDGLLKVINIEFMYRDDPAFDLQVLVSSMPRRLGDNRQQQTRKMCEVRLPMSPHDLEGLLERAKRYLDAIRHLEDLTPVDVL